MRMRCFVVLAMLILAFPTIAVCQEQAPTAVGRHRRVLLLGQKPDDHPAATHEYMAGVRLLAKLLSKTPDVQSIVVQADSPWKGAPELFDGADAVVVFLTEGARWVTEDSERLAAFQRLAKRGGGLSCLHWGMGTRDAGPVAEFTSLFGGCHGGPDRKYKVVSVTAKPAENRHPILRGIRPFEVRDEFYYALKKPAAELKLLVVPLIYVTIDGQDESVAWACERTDGGRSFGFSGLHFHENWKLVEYRRLVLQGILWSIKCPIPEAGLAVDVTAEELALPAVQTK